MKILSLSLPVVALGGAAVLLLPSESKGWNPLGGSLNLGQRDVRVFNNFTNAAANNNTTPDANFPGYDGAEMAIWKAIVEWGSELHGDGNGDPHQPGALGSGGANFDASWQGNHTAVGGSNGNTASLTTSCSSGVLAFMQGPISDGWTIRFCPQWSWQDGPVTSGGVDIQGVMAHEYGHALGLDHTNVSGATMRPSISGNGTGARSIATDDINGVRGVYGVADADKPSIDAISINGTQLTITGVHFTATGNDVWFTQAASGGNGDPIKVTNVNSTGGGTQIVVTIPAAAGPGDVLVQKSDTGGGALSNAWPFDPGDGGGPQELGTVYCDPAVPNSTGSPGVITVTGSDVVADDDLTLTATDLPTQSNIGYFLMGTGMNTFTPPGSAGPICVSPGILRFLPPIENTTELLGGFERVVGTSGPQTSNITPASTWNFQAWHRDSLAGTSNLTNAVSVTFQ